MPRRKISDPLVYEYMQTMKSFLATTRFNNTTWSENQHFITNSPIDVLDPKIKCVYPCSAILSGQLPLDSSIFVLEMNNETNLIEGIGLIRHKPPHFRKYHVYTQEKYNEYSYQGAHHIHRADITEEEMVYWQQLEKYCFKGRRHQKRMTGIKLFPPDILYEHKMSSECDLVQIIATMFKTRY